jgi:hypothetical protein
MASNKILKALLNPHSVMVCGFFMPAISRNTLLQIVVLGGNFDGNAPVFSRCKKYA